MDIREIVYINKVAEHRNLTRAAQDLHISQPSLSQSIKSIEKRLNITLFTRSKKGMVLTSAGEKFVKESESLLLEYNVFMDKLKSIKASDKGRSIGLYKLVHTSPISNIIMNYISNNVTGQYTLRTENITDLEDLLRKKTLEFAIIKYPPTYERTLDFTYNLLFEERLHVLIHKSHPLSKKTSLTIDDLEGMKVITSTKNEYPYKVIEKIISDATVELEMLVSTNYENTNLIFNFVEENLAITFATKYVCDFYQTNNIVSIPLEPLCKYEVCIVQNKHSSSRDNQKFIDFIKDQVHGKTQVL